MRAQSRLAKGFVAGISGVGAIGLIAAAGLAVAGSATATPSVSPANGNTPLPCGAYVTNNLAPRVGQEPCIYPEPPGPPTAVVGVPGSGQVAVSWTAPTYPGSEPILKYEVTASPGGAMCIATGPYTTPPTPVPTTCTVTGLTNGTAYTFTVRAQNAAEQSYSGGWGLPSNASAAVTPVAVTPTPTPTPSPPPSPTPTPTSTPTPPITIIRR